jgi:hypothetical protein
VKIPGNLRKLFSIRRVLAILTAAPIVAGLGALGTFKAVEPKLAPFIAAATVLKSPTGVALVVVDDRDLHEEFNGTATLGPEDLKKILQALANAGPRVIGVDFDTSRKEFASLQQETFGRIPIVWARRSEHSNRTGKSYVSDVLGGSKTALSALVELPEDEDQTVREYRRSFDTDGGDMWFLPSALMGDPYRSPPRPASDLPIKYHMPEPQAVRFRFIPQQAAQLRGKAVLVGGAYLGRDEHKTPLGWWPGVEILAEIAETDAADAHEPSTLLVRCVIYLFAVLTTVTFFAFSGRWWMGVCAGLAIILVCSALFQRFFGALDETLALAVTLLFVLGAEVNGRYLEWKKESDNEKLVEKIKAEIQKETQSVSLRGAD